MPFTDLVAAVCLLGSAQPERVIWTAKFAVDGPVKEVYEGSTVGNSVVAADGTIYVTSGGWITAISRYGRKEWSYHDEAPFASPPVIGANGNVYLAEAQGTYDNGMTLQHVSGYMVVLGRNGKASWKPDAEDYQSPVIGSDGTVYLTSSTGLVAYRPDGTKKWENVGAYMAPAVRHTAQGDFLYSSNMGYLFETRPDGFRRVLFRLRDLEPERTSMASGSGPTAGEPVVGNSGQLYLTTTSESGNGTLWIIHPSTRSRRRIDKETIQLSDPKVSRAGMIVAMVDGKTLKAFDSRGRRQWTYSIRGEAPDFEVAPNGTTYFSSGKELVALNRFGRKKWSFDAADAVSGFVVSPNGVTYLSTSDGSVDAIDADGHKKWSYKIGGGPTAPVIGPDGRVYVASSVGRLYAFRP